MDTAHRTDIKFRKSIGENVLPTGLNVEGLKRVNTMGLRLTEIGFPWESEIELERVVVQGEIQICC